MFEGFDMLDATKHKIKGSVMERWIAEPDKSQWVNCNDWGNIT